MIIRSALPYRQYLFELKKNLDGIFAFGEERVAGTVIWRFFSITSHAGYEWNRRITNEKQRAIGFAKPDGDGTKIYCIRLAGLTNPISLLAMFLLAMFLLGMVLLAAKGGSSLAELFQGALLFAGFMALFTAITDSWTERGMEAYRTLTAYLLDPKDYYSLLH